MIFIKETRITSVLFTPVRPMWHAGLALTLTLTLLAPKRAALGPASLDWDFACVMRWHTWYYEVRQCSTLPYRRICVVVITPPKNKEAVFHKSQTQFLSVHFFLIHLWFAPSNLRHRVVRYYWYKIFFSFPPLFSRKRVLGCRAALLGSFQAQTLFIVARYTVPRQPHTSGK